MVSSLLDTGVLIDVMRGYAPAVGWLQSQTVGTIGITPIVWMELIAGAQDKRGQLQALRLLSRFDMTYLTQQDMDWAMRQLFAYKLSHNIGQADCLIASVNHRLQIPFYTRNLRHFTPLLGALAQNPY